VFKQKPAIEDRRLGQFLTGDSVKNSPALTFDDKLVRKLVEKAIVYDDRLMVEFKSGLEIEVNL